MLSKALCLWWAVRTSLSPIFWFRTILVGAFLMTPREILKAVTQIGNCKIYFDLHWFANGEISFFNRVFISQNMSCLILHERKNLKVPNVEIFSKYGPTFS